VTTVHIIIDEEDLIIAQNKKLAMTLYELKKEMKKIEDKIFYINSPNIITISLEDEPGLRIKDLINNDKQIYVKSLSYTPKYTWANMIEAQEIQM
jgi:hypothetical protein